MIEDEPALEPGNGRGGALVVVQKPKALDKVKIKTATVETSSTHAASPKGRSKGWWLDSRAASVVNTDEAENTKEEEEEDGGKKGAHHETNMALQILEMSQEAKRNRQSQKTEERKSKGKKRGSTNTSSSNLKDEQNTTDAQSPLTDEEVQDFIVSAFESSGAVSVVLLNL